jgi:hypothetical protein
VGLYDLHCSLNIIYSGDKMKKNEIDERCGTYEGEKK